MTKASDAVREFFEAYALATASLDTKFLESAYAESFMFAAPAAVQTVKRDDFLKIVPKRKAFFASVGLTSELAGIDETVLDDHYLLVKAHWTFKFAKEGAPPVVTPGAATYILRRHNGELRIVFQLDHQDLTKRVQELGLLSQEK